MEIRKIIKLNINENLRNILNHWNISKYRYRRNMNFDLPSTLKASMKLFDCFEVSHLTFCETGFKIDFENNIIWLTSLEKYKRTPIKVAEENIEYLKKEINNGAKATILRALPPSYKKGHHRRREIVKKGHWELHVILKKNIELMTIEEFKKLQRIAVIGVDLNSKHGIAYSLWIWSKKENSMKPIKARFLPKIKSHQFQEIKKWQLQENHGNSVKYNELFQRINKRIQRQNKDWIEKTSKKLIDIALESIQKYNCEIAIISFEDLKEYEAGNNSKKINKKNAEWLRKIIQRTFEKSLWNYSMKVITYLPIYNKNQRNIQQILIDSYKTSRICSRCGNEGKLIKYLAKGKIKRYFKCNNCGYKDNRHFNASANIAKRAIEYLKKVAFPEPMC
ncbi:MAG: zinc ribbon domain-containing protein [Nitrososphaerota archaeon]